MTGSSPVRSNGDGRRGAAFASRRWSVRARYSPPKLISNNIKIMEKQNKKLFLSFFIFVFGLLTLFLSVQVAMACSPAQPTIVIEAQVDKNLLVQQKSCLDQNCLFVLEKDQNDYFYLKRTDNESTDYSGQNIGSVDKEGKAVWISYLLFNRNNEMPLNEIAFIEALDKLIENDISEIRPILTHEIKSWTKNMKGYFLGGNLIFTPYDQSKEAELLKEKNQFLDCRYIEYKRAGNWLIKDYASRDYCYLSGGGGGMCPSAVISYPKFIGFLFNNINGATAPYLSVFLILIVGVAVFTFYLIRKKELWFFLKPRKAKVIITIIAAVILSLGFLFGITSRERFSWYLLLIYFIVSLVGYIGLKRKTIEN